MVDIKNPVESCEVIEAKDLLVKVLEKKKEGLRLSQICAAYTDGKYELSYSFENEENFDFVTLRVYLELEEEIPSVSEILPHAVFYENEMKELYGVNIKMINLDFENKLYRIKTKTPLLPPEERKRIEDARKSIAEAEGGIKEED